MRRIDKTSFWMSLALAAGFISCGRPANRAESRNLTLYEGFSYPPGSALVGQNGGKGFYGAWTSGGFNVRGAGDYLIGEGSLEYPGISSSGNRLVCASGGTMQGVLREFMAPFQKRTGKCYLSVLVRPEPPPAGAAQGYFGLMLSNNGGTEIFFGQAGLRGAFAYTLEYRGGRDRQTTGVKPMAGATMLLVLRAEFNSGAETYTLFVNPGETEPATGATLTTTGLAFPYLAIYSSGSFSLDEIRAGDIYESVAPRKKNSFWDWW